MSAGENQIRLDDAKIAKIRRLVVFLYSKIATTARRRADCEDLEQDILADLLEGIQAGKLKFPNDAALFGYLRPRIKGACADAGRRAARSKVVTSISQVPDDSQVIDRVAAPPNWDSMDSDYFKSLVREEAPTVAQFLFDNKSYKQLAAERKKTVEAVRQQFHRELKELSEVAHKIVGAD